MLLKRYWLYVLLINEGGSKMIRQGELKDISSIREIFYDAVSWMQHNHIKQWDYKDLDLLYSNFELKEFFICFNSENNAVGFMILSERDINCCWKKLQLDKAIYLYKLTVKRIYSKLGYSSELLQFAIKYATDNQKNWLCLCCLKSKSKQRELYENHGFHKLCEQVIPFQTEVSLLYIHAIETNQIKK